MKKHLLACMVATLVAGLMAIPVWAVPPEGTANNVALRRVMCKNKTTGQRTRGTADINGNWSCGRRFIQNNGDVVVIMLAGKSTNDVETCVGQECGGYTGDCDPFIDPCYCWIKADGGTLCSDDFYCSTAEPCATDSQCPVGEACIIGGCCGGSPGVCGPTECTGGTYGSPPGDGTAPADGVTNSGN